MPKLPAGRAALPCLALFFVVVSAVGCGKKGEPLPPLRIVPQATTDLKVSQQGNQLLLEMTYPAVTTSGAALNGIDAVELFELVLPAPVAPVASVVEDDDDSETAASGPDEPDEDEPDEDEPDEGESEDDESEQAKPVAAPTVTPADPRVFESSAKVLQTLRGAELGAAVTGDRIAIKLPLDQRASDEPEALHFAVRTIKLNERSMLSNRVAIVAIEAPEPPTELTLDAGANGVTIGWRIVGEDPAFFNIFRRLAQNRGYGKPIGQVPGSRREYFDRGASYGQRYIYTVRTVASRQPLILSAESGEREIRYQDRFAPPLPARFVALGESGSVRLRWDRSTAKDVAGYYLFRRDPGRDFESLNSEPVAGLEFLDRGLAAGLSYDYRIQAIDEVGNLSAKSRPISATVR